MRLSNYDRLETIRDDQRGADAGPFYLELDDVRVEPPQSIYADARSLAEKLARSGKHRKIQVWDRTDMPVFSATLNAIRAKAYPTTARAPLVAIIKDCELPWCNGNCGQTGEARRAPGPHHKYPCPLNRLNSDDFHGFSVNQKGK